MDPDLIVVPWRDSGEPHRRRSCLWVRDRLAALFPTAALILADDGRQPWSRAASIDAAILASSAELILVSDADLAIPAEQLAAALAAAAEAPGQVVPFDHYRYLELEQSEAIRLGQVRESAWPRVSARFTMRSSLGGAMAISRASWAEAGGHDPRFRGWGGQDYGFAHACATLVAPMRRIPGPVVHLWHPADPTNNRAAPSYDRNMRLMTRYAEAAKAGPEAMRALIGER